MTTNWGNDKTMAKKKKTMKKVSVENYKHDSAKRKNIPTAKMAAEGKIPRMKKIKYGYSAHLFPELRFDTTGDSDRVNEIVEKATSGKKLTNEEVEILRGLATNASQPWLEWSGKKEEHARGLLEVEPVALHIHERVSANAIIRTAKREDVQADLFADPQQEYKEAIQFYQHDVDWANRMILGDSLEVMSSLSRREDLSSKVQMIYIDPPYGIKYASNFQPEIGQRDVKDKDSDLIREPEMVKAYRDTWHLGIHSYLSYLNDRLIVAKELLSETGSVFVQISDENLHRVRQLMSEIFGESNFVAIITLKKTAYQASKTIANVSDFLIWFSRDIRQIKVNQLFMSKFEIESAGLYRFVDLPIGERRSMILDEISGIIPLPDGAKQYRLISLISQGASKVGSKPVSFHGKHFECPSNSHWKTTQQGILRLIGNERIIQSGRTLAWAGYVEDFPVSPFNNIWTDTMTGSFTEPKTYVVQTNSKIIERCMLMTSDPADLILDPTCGSGTTAYVAEKWGRRWITIDSSRVALSLARQRILTAIFDYYCVNNESANDTSRIGSNGTDPSANFIYKSVPHITLGSIARNENLDPIIAKHEVLLEKRLEVVNEALNDVDDSIRNVLVNKFAAKLQASGLRATTDADRRRWLLPSTTKEQIQKAYTDKSKLKAKHVNEHAELVPPNSKFEHWHVPFSNDPAWPETLSVAVKEYRIAWRQKMDELNACIDANTECEVLVNQPEIMKDVVRVSGPFTVEGVRPEELSLNENWEIFDPTPNEWEVNETVGNYAQNAAAYVDRMLKLIEEDGVTFPNNEHRDFVQIDRLEETDSALHAEALWEMSEKNQPCNIAVAFGPQHGPVTAEQVEDLIRASRRYDELVIAGFSFDGAAQAVIQESANPRLKIHMAHIRPDVSPGMDGLLKDSPKSQLFTVFGQPEIDVRPIKDAENGEREVELLGVDIYSPLTGEITSSGADKVAAWFLDSDYDGRCFCITQAFFPNQKAWDKIAKALGSAADADAFAAYAGTTSVPFEPGQYQRIAVKVIDPRGNEVMAIRSLGGSN